MAKPDVVVEVVLVVDAPSVDSGAADADALVPFFLPILLNRTSSSVSTAPALALVRCRRRC